MEKLDAKILLVGVDLSDLNEIRKSLSAEKNYRFFEAYNLKDAFTLIKDNKVDLIVFDIDDITQDKINSILSLRKDDEKSPIVLLGNSVNELAMEILRVFPNILVLEKPHGIEELPHVAAKFLRGETVYQRKHKRFSTNQTAQIVLFSNGQQYNCSVINLSKGGAFLEIKNLKDKIDGLIKIKLNLDEIQKDYTLSAKIVWISVKPEAGLLGVQFIKNNDIYSQFLKNF